MAIKGKIVQIYEIQPADNDPITWRFQKRAVFSLALAYLVTFLRLLTESNNAMTMRTLSDLEKLHTFQSHTQSPRAFWSAGERPEGLWDTEWTPF